MLQAVLLLISLSLSFATSSHLTPTAPVLKDNNGGYAYHGDPSDVVLQIPRSLSFEHRHLHSVTSTGQILFADVKGDLVHFEASEDNEPLSILTRSINIPRPVSFESFMHERRLKRSAAAHDDRLCENGNGCSNTALITEERRSGSAIWSEEPLEAPDVTDRKTLLSLAKMTRNAYLDISDNVTEEWYVLDGWNKVRTFSSSFGCWSNSTVSARRSPSAGRRMQTVYAGMSS